MDQWTPDFWIANEAQCKNTLMEPGNWEKVPLLSNNKPAVGTLVRFKGMIQDMLNPEYYSNTFSVVNSVTNEKRLYQGKYHSFVLNETDEEVQLGNDFDERQVFALIQIPGLNDWAKEENNSIMNIEDRLEGNSNKRIHLDSIISKCSKEILVFVYPEEVSSGLKVNSIIDVVGFFDQRIIQNDNEEMGETSTSTAKEIYCIHTVQIKLLSNLIPSNEEMNKCIWEQASNIHAELKLILTQALLGDSLAADYLLFYLVSSIYNRQPNQVPGKFSLNISGIPNNIGKNYTTKLYSLISYLVQKSEYLPLTVNNMNTLDMVPRKCYVTDRLLNGFLQLSDRTHLVLDETNLQPGKLEEKGMLNMQALTDIISNQQIKYDFTYYTINYETQIPVLTLSTGKSLLPCDIEIVLNPDPSCANNIEETIDSAHIYLKSKSLLLENLRKYIAIISTLPFSFNENILEIIENDYVAMRKANVKSVSPDDLHHFMVISKLIALCSGKNELNEEVWECCKTIENQRKLRS